MHLTITIHHLPSGNTWVSGSQEVTDDQMDYVETIIEQGVEKGFTSFSLTTHQGEFHFNKKIMEDSVVSIKKEES